LVGLEKLEGFISQVLLAKLIPSGDWILKLDPRKKEKEEEMCLSGTCGVFFIQAV
jgi:hypothetical protein